MRPVSSMRGLGGACLDPGHHRRVASDQIHTPNATATNRNSPLTPSMARARGAARVPRRRARQMSSEAAPTPKGAIRYDISTTPSATTKAAGGWPPGNPTPAAAVPSHPRASAAAIQVASLKGMSSSSLRPLGSNNPPTRGVRLTTRASAAGDLFAHTLTYAPPPAIGGGGTGNSAWKRLPTACAC